MEYKSKCPNPTCQANLIAGEIPEKNRCGDECEDACVDAENHHYGKDSRFFYRSVGFSMYDRTLFHYCPDCDAAWHCLPEGSRVRTAATVHMRREGKRVYLEKFEVGKRYLTQGGETIEILAETHLEGYECVKGSDDIWRYNRPSDLGRVTASAFDMSDPRNLVASAVS